MTPDDWIDVLEDLKHDLGKYLVLPVAMLDEGADQASLRGAVDTALHRTRRGPAGVQSARALWQAFEDEVGGGLAEQPGAAAVSEAVERALAWSDTLSGSSPIEREQVLSDFRAVGRAIGEWIAVLRESQGA